MNQRDLETWRSLENDPLDRELDAALANYAAVEPRAGIEQRILANLRAEQNHASVRPWWRLPAGGAILVAGLVVAVLLASKFSKPAPNLTAHHVPTVTLPAAESQTYGNNRPGGAAPAPRKKPMRVARHRENQNASAPKLDVFPSPKPLSEQEKMLVAYVAQHRQQAVLIARARMAELKQDMAKEADRENSAPNRQPSQQEHESAEDR